MVTIMIKCANCTEAAEYVSETPYAATAHFCGSCIPWTLINEHRAGLLPRLSQPTVAVEEPVVEPEPVVEVDTKKSTSKKVAETTADPGAANVSDN